MRNMMDIDMDLFQGFLNFLMEKPQVEQLKLKIFLIKNKPKNYKNQLFKKSIIKDSTFIDNILGADPAYMQVISKCDKGLRLLLCVIDIYSKYAWVIFFKDKKKNYNY